MFGEGVGTSMAVRKVTADVDKGMRLLTCEVFNCVATEVDSITVVTFCG